MGDTAKNIDWNPANSTLGQTFTGGGGSVFKSDVLDPRQSTLGQFAQGNYGNALNQTVGGIGKGLKAGWDIQGGVLNPLGGINDVSAGVSGAPQAEKRRQQDQQNQAADYMGVQRDQQAQEMQRQQQEQQAAAQKAQQDKLNQYNLSQQSIADEDAFTKARNAARRAQGQTLFGAWG